MHDQLHRHQHLGDNGRATPVQSAIYDAANTAPAQDRLLFDLFTTALNDNATRGQLSVNVGAGDPNDPQAGLAAWSALFSGVDRAFQQCRRCGHSDQ